MSHSKKTPESTHHPLVHKKHYDFVILFGPPCIGKGTSAKEIAVFNGYRVISGSEILKLRIAHDNIFKEQVAKMILTTQTRGVLVDDTIMMDTFKWALEYESPGSGEIPNLVLDGIPRTVHQALLLGQFFHQIKPDCSIALVSFEKVSRMMVDQRRLKRIDEFISRGEKPRDDDVDVETFKRRLDEHYSTVDQIIAVTSKFSDYFPIDASKSSKETFRRVADVLGLTEEAKALGMIQG